MIALAIETGISPSVWADEGERAIVTAYDLIEKRKAQQQQQQSP